MGKPNAAYQCHHIRENGKRCGSPHMKGKVFCYYHNRLHESFILPGQSFYDGPVLDNFESVEMALTHVYRATAKRTITALEAKVMLFNIQLAQQNLRMKAKNTPIRPAPDDQENDYTRGMRHVYFIEDDSTDQPFGAAAHGRDLDHNDTCGAAAPENEELNENEEWKSVAPDRPDHLLCGAVAPGGDLDPHNDPCGAAALGREMPASKLSLPQRPPHPLAECIGIRPWRTPKPMSNETPTWHPITDDEFDYIYTKLYNEEDEASATPEQKHAVRRLKISTTLRGNKTPTTRELIEAIARVEEEEEFLRRDREAEKRRAAAYIKAHADKKRLSSA